MFVLLALGLRAESARADDDDARAPAVSKRDSSNRSARSRSASGDSAPPAGVTRVEVLVGQLDPRLRLAPCERIEPYLPPNTRLWGKSRIGLRCAQGPSHWNVFLPITVKAYGRALVARRASRRAAS